MALNPITELEQIVDAFRAAGISYALCGGLALGLHGQHRATQEIDFLDEAPTLPPVNEGWPGGPVVRGRPISPWSMRNGKECGRRRSPSTQGPVR